MSESFPTRTLDEIANDLGFPVAAVELVESITADMAWHAQNAGMIDVPHLTAAGFCQLFRRHIVTEFGKSGASVLKSWGLHGSDELGRIVFALVSAGWMIASPDDSIDDFAGQFTADEYFA